MENKSSSSPYAVLLLCSIGRGRGPSIALIFIYFQFLDTDFIELFSTGSKLEGEPTVGRKEEFV